MQNKGFVKVFAVLLTLVCVFYLSFSFVTRYHMDKAAQDPKKAASVQVKAQVKAQEMSTHEGECIESEPEHCAVKHSPDSVYATEISDKPKIDFSREQLVNGIIMAELLSKPKCFENQKF